MILLDGGDCFFSSPTKKAPTKAEEVQELRKGRAILNAYNFLGYRAIGLGPADLQMGIPTLRDFEKEAKFAFVCANLVDKQTKKPLFRPYVVIEEAGVKFGVYAVMMSLTNDTYVNRVIPDAEVLDPEKVTAAIVPELRKACDIVIALSHLNVDTNEKILDTIPGIDVLIDPFSRNGNKAIWLPENEYLVKRNQHPLLRIDGQGSRVGVFDMYFAPGAKQYGEFQFTDGALEPHILRHPEMTALVDDFERGHAKPYDITFDTQKPRLFSEFMGQEGCGTCHAEQLAFWKSTKHADTYSTLVKTTDEGRMDCVGCHSFAYGVAFADTQNVGKNKEVQCESCHGLRTGHAENPKGVKVGKAPEEPCWGCHNPQIARKDFPYTAAREKVSCPKIQR